MHCFLQGGKKRKEDRSENCKQLERRWSSKRWNIHLHSITCKRCDVTSSACTPIIFLLVWIQMKAASSIRSICGKIADGCSWRKNLIVQTCDSACPIIFNASQVYTWKSRHDDSGNDKRRSCKTCTHLGRITTDSSRRYYPTWATWTREVVVSPFGAGNDEINAILTSTSEEDTPPPLL
jgi:hypothetical protein